MYKFVIFIILFTAVLSKYFIIGPAKITIVQIVPCEEYKNSPIKISLVTRMYNKTTQLVDFDFILPFELNENITVGIKAYKIDNNIERNVISIEENSCDILIKYAGDLWHRLEEHLGLPINSCPIPQGNYSTKDYYLNLDDLKIKVLLEGHFRSRIIFKQLNKTISCYDCEFKLEPKT